VAGAPDDEWGERVVAFVVPAPDAAPPSLESLRAFARERLTAAELPREIRVVTEIPRTAGGKPRRVSLRSEA
jgi:acyl-CoA synthetase (AMP-forming)/AMP-acid ligase II